MLVDAGIGVLLMDASIGVLVAGCCWVLVVGAGDGACSLLPSPSPPLFSGCTAQVEGAKEATPSPGSSQSENELQEGGGTNVDGKETPPSPPQTSQGVPMSPGGPGSHFPTKGCPHSFEGSRVP